MQDRSVSVCVCMCACVKIGWRPLFFVIVREQENQEMADVLSKPKTCLRKKALRLETSIYFHLNVQNQHAGARTCWHAKKAFPCSHTCTANMLIQWFCITHNSMPALSSHPSGTNASPTTSTGALGGRSGGGGAGELWRTSPSVPASRLLCQTTTVWQ